MGKRKNNRARTKAHKETTSLIARFIRPTEQQEAQNDYQSAGAAVRIVPVIDTLLKAGKLSQAEYDALDYYADQATRAEDDTAQASTLAPERVMGGNGGACSGGMIPALLMATPAILEASRIERDLGSLRDIAEAVAVRNWSLTRWCIQQHGGRERYDGKGRFVAMVPMREREVMGIALMELKMAARRIYR